MSITRKDLDHVIKLAHVHIPDEDKDAYLNDMTHTLDLMSSLDGLDLEGADPTAYAIQQDHYQRDDVVDEPKDFLLEKNAPKWEGDAFHVPQILGEASA